MQIVSFLSTRVPRLRQIFIPFICGVLIAGAVIPSLTTAQSGKNDEIYRQLGLFGDIFQRVRESYVDEVKEKDLIEADEKAQRRIKREKREKEKVLKKQ